MATSLADYPAGREVAAFLSSPRRLLIGADWVEAISGRTFEAENPAEERPIAEIAEGTAVDIDRAVAAARRAFDHGPWPRMRPAERAALIHALGDAVAKHVNELALLETLDTGKPLRIALKRDLPRCAERMHYYAGWAARLTGDTLSSVGPEDWHAYTMREPVGVVGLITPWNLPLLMVTLKLGAALAAGCTVVLKPAEQTSLTALRLGELAQQVGFPEGVFNIITGFGPDAGAALAAHPHVDKISFTGSTAVGKSIVQASLGNLKRLTLELGGKSPVIVFADAALDQAIPAVANGIFANSGQVCSAGSRLFVHRDVFDQVLEGIVEIARGLQVGPGLDSKSEMGPLISAAQLQRVSSFVAAGVESGARIATGGERLPGPGHFFAPTIMTDVARNSPVRNEEIFGPVLCAMPFDDNDLDRLAEDANETVYGLASYVWTQDLSTAHRMARKIKAGLVNINGGARDDTVPSGGFKQSGWGRESGREGVEAFTELKSVLVGL